MFFFEGQAVIFLLRLKATSQPRCQYFAGNWVRKAHHEQFWFMTAIRVISRTIRQRRELCFADRELVSLDPRNHLPNLTASWTCSSGGSPWKSPILLFSSTFSSLQSRSPQKQGQQCPAVGFDQTHGITSTLAPVLMQTNPYEAKYK